MRFQNKNIAQVGYSGEVADYAGKANLGTLVIINPEAQRMLDGARDGLARDAFGPITICEEVINDLKIEPSGIRADEELSATVLDDG